MSRQVTNELVLCLFLLPGSLLVGCSRTAEQSATGSTDTAASGVVDNPEATLNQLLAMLDARRSMAGDGGYRWEFEQESFTVPLPRAEGLDGYAAALEKRATNPLVDATKDPVVSFKGEIVWQPSTGRYLLSAEHVSKWIDGKADYIATREQIAFSDGKYATVQNFKHGTELPTDEAAPDHDPKFDPPPIATLSDEPTKDGAMERIAMAGGFMFRPGFIAFPSEWKWGESFEIADYLRQLRDDGREITLRQKGDLLEANFLVPDKDGHPRGRGTMTLVFNTAQQAAVERITFVANGPGGRTYRNADYFIQNVEVSPGAWMPKEIVWGDWMNPKILRTRISNAKMIDELKEEDLVVDYPDRTQFLVESNRETIVLPLDSRGLDIGNFR